MVPKKSSNRPQSIAIDDDGASRERVTTGTRRVAAARDPAPLPRQGRRRTFMAQLATNNPSKISFEKKKGDRKEKKKEEKERKTSKHGPSSKNHRSNFLNRFRRVDNSFFFSFFWLRKVRFVFSVFGCKF